MAKRIKLPVGRRAVATTPRLIKVEEANRVKKREAAEAHRIRSRFDKQPTTLKRERSHFVDKWKYHDNRRPPGVGHLTNDPLLSEPSKVLKAGGYTLAYDAEVMDPFACGTAPVFVEDTDWTRRKVMVNKTSFPTLHLPWITCGHCLVIIDWGLTSGYLEANELNEVVDPKPDDPERKKLRNRWRRLLRARREPEPSTEKPCSSESQ